MIIETEMGYGIYLEGKREKIRREEIRSDRRGWQWVSPGPPFCFIKFFLKTII